MMARPRQDEVSLNSEGEEDVEIADDEIGDEEEGTEEEGTESASATVVNERGAMFFHGHAALHHSPTAREIGHEAVWSLSTAKPGNGVEQIRDGSCDTYWQSDGSHPHLINIQFARRASVSSVAFYLDYNLDESYTPKRMSIRAGMTHHDLVEVRVVELNEPVGWVTIPLSAPPDPLDLLDDVNGERKLCETGPLRAHFIQITIISMHQNGRDTHVRQVKIFGPRRTADYSTRHLANALPEFQTVEMTQYSTIR